MNLQTTKPRARLMRSKTWRITFPDKPNWIYGGCTNLDMSLKFAFESHVAKQAGLFR